MEYDVAFPSIFVNSFTLVFKASDSSFAAHCFAFCRDCSFRSRVCSSDSLGLSKISNVVEEGRVEYVPVLVPSPISPGPSNLRASSGKSKKRSFCRSPVKRRFEVASPPPASQKHRIVEDLGFSAALDRQQSCKKSGCSDRKRRAAPVFQVGLP